MTELQFQYYSTIKKNHYHVNKFYNILYMIHNINQNSIMRDIKETAIIDEKIILKYDLLYN